MQYTIRQADDADHDLIYGLFSESVRPYVKPIWGWDESCQRKDFDESFVFSQFWVVEVGGAFAGFLQTNTHENMLELCEIHLKPAFRGRGIGSAVIKNLLAEASVVRTGCFKENTRAGALYYRLGFRQAGETETHILLEFHK